MKLRIHPLLAIFLFVVATSLWLYFLMQWKGAPNKKNDPAADTFNRAALQGRLVAKQFRAGKETIKLDNNNGPFTFRPHISADGSLFHANTDLGDSIIKPALSPVIVVKSSGKTYRYTFEQ